MTTVHHLRRRLAHLGAPAHLSALSANEFEGYASLFGVPDGAGDIVAPGAFRRSLRERPPALVRMLYQHSAVEPIGVWEEIKEDARGLYVRGHIVSGVQRGREVLSLLRDGALDGLSIGFRTRRARRDPATGHRILLDLELWEVSVVTFPLLSSSHVTAIGAKGDQLFASLQRMSTSLRTRSNAIVPGKIHPPLEGGSNDRANAKIARGGVMSRELVPAPSPKPSSRFARSRFRPSLKGRVETVRMHRE